MMRLFQPQQPENGDPAVEVQDRKTQQRMIGVLIVVAGALALAALAVWAYGTQNNESSLFPNLPSPTPSDRVVSSVAVEVSFSDLNDNPSAYLNKVIQATGSYTPLDVPDCRPFAGPVIEWSLVGDGLQLNAKGFERILRLANPGMEMTVVGVWRLYDGPVGCGKEPPDDVVWYLDVSRIIEPNPLFGGPGGVLTFVPGDVVTAESARPTLESTPELAPTAVFATQGAPESLTVTPDSPFAPASTATELPLTPLATPGAQSTPTPTTSGTPDPDVTPATPDPNATPTSVPSGTETPVVPASTPTTSGYPAASPTVGGYP